MLKTSAKFCILFYTITMKKIFIKAFDSVNITSTDEQLDKMLAFYDILIDYNQKINLTRIVSEEDSAYKHFADSVVGSTFIPENAKVCDIGSGGGFPAIPLAIMSKANFTLVDATMKKVNYLNYAIESLGLKNAVAIQSRAEDLGTSEKRESFDVVTARAVASLPTLLEYCLPLVKVGGIFIAYKTTDVEELASSQKALKTLGGKVEKLIPYSLGEFGADRELIIVKKIAPTPKNYPRGQNKPRIKPIG